MSEKLRPFRWLGVHGPMDDRKGALWVSRKNPDVKSYGPEAVVRKVYLPGDVIRDPLDLEALGEARIREIVQFEQGEYIDLLTKLGADELLDRPRVQHDTSDHDRQLMQAANDEAAIGQVVDEQAREDLRDPRNVEALGRAQAAQSTYQPKPEPKPEAPKPGPAEPEAPRPPVGSPIDSAMEARARRRGW